MRHSRPLLLLTAALSLAACGDQTPLDPDLRPGESFSVLRSGPHAWDGTTPLNLTGTIGPGADYGIMVPPGWNGDLVLYAHGFVDPDGSEPLTPEEQALIAAFAQAGYGVAYSAFSENGLAVKDGVQRTQQLRGLFRSNVGLPDRTFVVGGSLGGLIGIALAERFPQHYAGVLALCGMVGGSQAQIDYVSHVRVLFDALYPGVLPGSLFDNPPLSRMEVAMLVGGAVAADPAGAAALAGVMASTFGTPVPFATPEQLVQSLVVALAFNIRGFEDVLDRTRGHSPFGNDHVVYSGTGTPMGDAWLNEAVARYEATPDAARYFDHFYEPDGSIGLPVVTLHNMLDPAVPAFHEALLAADVGNAGAQSSLVQLTADRYGHCAFEQAEVLGAFGMMVAAAGS